MSSRAAKSDWIKAAAGSVLLLAVLFAPAAAQAQITFRGSSSAIGPGAGTITFRLATSAISGNILFRAASTSGTPTSLAPAFRAAASASSPTGVLALTINRPANTVENDVMVASIGVSAGSPTITPPAGWTLARKTDNAAATAIFLVVILAMLGVFILSVTGLQQSSQVLDVQGVRAYQAARAGIEWGAYQVLDPNNNQPGIGGTANLPVCPASPANLPVLAESLSIFTVTVQCDATLNAPTTEGNRNVGAYRIIANACNQPSGGSCPNPAPASGYVERQMEAVLSKCKDPTAVGPRFECG